jgi:hypothetical protein
MNVEAAFKIAFDVTAWFETDGKPFTEASGNFDGQGFSWGPRHTCIGQGSLPPLMRKMLEVAPDKMAQALGPLLQSFKDVARSRPTAEQLEIVVRDWNDEKGGLKPEWDRAVAALGVLPEVQQVFVDDARESIPATNVLAGWIALGSQPTVREWCLAYDYVTQNGGFHSAFRASISTMLLALKPFMKDNRDRMRAICWLRGGWTYIRGQRRFAEDVLWRKLVIVEGRLGFRRFRGSDLDVDAKFGVVDELVA